MTAVRDGYTAPDLDADMAYCRTLRDKVMLSLIVNECTLNITGSYLIQRHAVTAVRDGYTSPDLDADMAFCRTLRDKVSLSMFVSCE